MKKPTFSERVARKTREFGKDLTNKIIALIFFGFAALCFWILIQLLYYFYEIDIIAWIQSTEYIYPVFKSIVDEIAARSALGIVYLFMFAGLFFLPIPLEALFTKLLLDGFDTEFLFMYAFLGILAGQHINFLLGKFFGYLIRPYIKKKTRKWMRAKLKKYGVIVLFVFNVFPLPFPIFNFVVGLSRYSYFKWVLTVGVAIAVKLGVIILIYSNVG